MTVFRGRHHIKIDPKGRLSFPADLRARLDGVPEIVITNGLVDKKRCLDLYTKKAWRQLESRLDRLPALNRNVQAFNRFYLASGQTCGLDRQARLLIPQVLREYAGLTEDVVVIGMGGKIEIWDAATWNSLFAQLEQNFDSIMENIASMDKPEGK